MTFSINTVGQTGSTNADMLERARNGGEEGNWLRAGYQTGGRGRLGRTWQSSLGNLFASTLVRVQPCDPQPATLALVIAVALAELVTPFAQGRVVSIKWPNDVLLGGAKLAGILLERCGDAVVIGVGVNLAHHPEGLDRPVTSLGNGAPDPGYFCEELAKGFARWLGRWRGEGLAAVRDAWLEKAHPVGTALTANLPDGSSMDGMFDGLNEDGALRLRLADGAVRVIHAGDVFLI